MKKIILLIILVLIVFFFFIPIRKIVTGCFMTRVSENEIQEKTKILTPFQAFKQGYMHIPTPNNNWTLITEPNDICV